MLTAEDINAIEDWLRRLELVRDDLFTAAQRNQEAANAMVNAASGMREAAGTMMMARR